ncbi:MAG: type II toxin-antitoxin system prevent-host-death family antitoxin [Actinobacteria bacterium]|nr:type II toxin-antitoxin system prevent-host-death family antitoxin [Actinomycetota bacterium]
MGAHAFRERFGYYLERAAAGDGVRITRRGRPYAVLSAADDLSCSLPSGAF